MLTAPDEVPHGMAAQRVPTQHDHIHRQHERADSDTKRDYTGRRIREPERFPDIGCQNEKENDGKIEKIPVNILNDQRERMLTAIMLPRFSNSTCGRIHPESLVIGSAVVIARQSKTTRRPKDQKRRRERQPYRPPAWSRPKPTVRRIAEDLRRVERRKIRSEIIVIPLKCRPRRVDNECRQSTKDRQRFGPPRVATCGLTEGSRFQ